MPELKPLWVIQNLEDKNRRLKQKLFETKAPQDLQALKKELDGERVAYDKLKEKFAVLKRNLKNKEMEINAAGEKLASLDRKLYGGDMTNVKELNSTSKKIDILKEKIKQEEDEMLNLMEEQELLSSNLEEISSRLEEKISIYRRMQDEKLADRKKIEQLLAQNTTEWEKLVDKLDDELWEKYQVMKKKMENPLARVVKGICRGCQVGVSFDDLRFLKQGKGPVFCNNCGRMLYWEK
jgi:hypothetical protein